MCHYMDQVPRSLNLLEVPITGAELHLPDLPALLQEYNQWAAASDTNVVYSGSDMLRRQIFAFHLCEPADRSVAAVRCQSIQPVK